MDFSKATREQLWTIISDDWYVPKEIMKELVTEGLNRGVFDNLIKHLINKMFDRWSEDRRYHFNDLFQVGYIGIIRAAKNYKEGKGAFKSFAYMNIKSEFNHIRDKNQSKKRKVYDGMVSLDVQTHDETDSTFLDSLIDDTWNTEKAVINKLFWDENFSRVNQLEKDVLIMFADGYSMQEIARIKGYKGAAFISTLFHRAAGKINPNYVKRSLKELGLMTRTKEVSA